jgi:hypothetical protein
MLSQAEWVQEVVNLVAQRLLPNKDEAEYLASRRITVWHRVNRISETVLGATEPRSDGAGIHIYLPYILNPMDLALTVIHECAHAITADTHNHDALWKANAARLGLLDATAYKSKEEHLAPDLVKKIKALPPCEDWFHKDRSSAFSWDDILREAGIANL